MNSTKQKILQKYNLKFKEELASQKEFFNKPDTLVALGVLSISMLEKFVDKTYTEDIIKKFIKTDKIAKNIIKYTSLDFDEQILSDLLLQCQKQEISENFNNFDFKHPEDFLKIANLNSDFDKKLNFPIFNNLKAFLSSNEETINSVLSYSFLLYHISLMTIDTIKNSEHPSKYRIKYIQRLSRNTAGAIKSQWADISSDAKIKYNKILEMLKQVDNILIALSMATALYFYNRKMLQNKSHNTLQEISKDKACIDLLNPTDISINAKPFVVNFNCPVELDDLISSHVPMEEKLKNISCNIVQNEENVVEIQEKTDLVTKAIIKNIRTEKMITELSIDSKVNEKTHIASINNLGIFSPVIGTISDIQVNQIFLRDISDPNEDYLTQQINLLNQKYTELNDIKFLLKNFYVLSLYPTMLKISLEDDTSTKNITNNVKSSYDMFAKEYKNLNKDYEKDIKKIAHKDNVEKHAKNESLNIVKEEIDNREKVFYNFLESLGNKAINNAKIIAVNSKEYTLINTYLTDLKKLLDETINPSKLETDFKNIIHNYVLDIKIETTKSKIIKHGSLIEIFFKNLWKQYRLIPKEIENIQTVIENLSAFPTTYSITNYNGEDHRLYTIPEPTKCVPGKDELDPISKYHFEDIQYWIKYCAGATLASIANPVTGWSTGFITPPLLFPVVYIPIKPILTQYGFIVLGISICGLYVFPWSLFVNYTTNYTLPFLDPTISLKNEINALKQSIAKQMAQFRKISIKKVMDETKEDLNNIEIELKNYKEQLKQNILLTPSPLKENLQLRELIASTSLKKWKIEQKYEILHNAYKIGSSTKEIDAKLKDEEKLINSQLDKLNKMTDNIDNIVAPLPISMKPNTANFGITLKNPKPLIKIADELDDNINQKPLNDILLKFKLKNKDLMSSNYKKILSSSDFKLYKQAVLLSLPLIIKKDPFPRYENLKITNVQWLAFLYKDFVSEGAKTFGFPGNPPFPI